MFANENYERWENVTEVTVFKLWEILYPSLYDFMVLYNYVEMIVLMRELIYLVYLYLCRPRSQGGVRGSSDTPQNGQIQRDRKIIHA